MISHIALAIVLALSDWQPGQYLTALAISSAPNRDAAFNGCPATFVRVSDQNLNDGTSGNFIFLCGKYDSDARQALTDVRIHDSVAESCAAWMTSDKHDLNEGADGRRLYLCFGRRPNATLALAISDLDSRTFDRAPVSPPDVICQATSTPVLSDFDDLPADVNRGAGGKYIYLCITRGTTKRAS
jgi:hypothetical protein